MTLFASTNMTTSGFEFANGLGRSIQIVNTLVLLLFSIVLPIFICVYVYRDAKRRGMSAGLWTVAVLLIPFYIGVIIYLIVRQNYNILLCPACQAAVEETHILCPQCGNPLKAQCASCHAVLDPSWRLCPQCGTPLSQMDFTMVQCPQARKDSGARVLIAALIAVPVGLILLLGVAWLFFAVDTNVGPVSLNVVATSAPFMEDGHHIHE